MDVIDIRMANDPFIESKNREFYELEKPKVLEVIQAYKSLYSGEIPSFNDHKLDEKLLPILKRLNYGEPDPVAVFRYTVNELLDIKKLYYDRFWVS
ncbi:MAG: hypothetical protein ACFFD4_24735 [Candidatus Odinarchaeota archaeon]